MIHYRRKLFILWVLISVFAIISVACAGGQGEENQVTENQNQEVVRTVVANPEEMQQIFMKVADTALPIVVEVNVLQNRTL